MTRSFSKFETRLNSVGLHEKIEKRALAWHVTLRELYEGPDRAPSIVAARRSVYAWLHTKKKKSINEIAQLFDRAPNGVWKLVGNGKSKRKKNA